MKDAEMTDTPTLAQMIEAQTAPAQEAREQ